MQKLGKRSGPRANVEMPAELLAGLQAEARRHHVSVSAVVRWAIEHYLARPIGPPITSTERAS